METFALFLPCGCPASYVHAESEERAVKLLLGDGTTLRHSAHGCHIREAGPDTFRAVLDELTAAPGRRWECRAEHGAPV